MITFFSAINTKSDVFQTCAAVKSNVSGCKMTNGRLLECYCESNNCNSKDFIKDWIINNTGKV